MITEKLLNWNHVPSQDLQKQKEMQRIRHSFFKNHKLFNPPYYFCKSDSWFLTYTISSTYFQNQSFE